VWRFSPGGVALRHLGTLSMSDPQFRLVESQITFIAPPRPRVLGASMKSLGGDDARRADLSAIV
jgi:hypothetical protein